MIFEKLNSTVLKFTHIFHVADIHVRLTKRHAEFRKVFTQLYREIDNTPSTTIICVLGDVCHSKSDLSPECVQMVSDFLWNLAERRETILIPGNHDAQLSNKTRMDSLSPIVNTLNHSKLHYLKESKLYGIGNVLFNNMCIFDDPEKYIRGIKIPEIYRNQYKHIIALFHGPVDRAVTDTGFSVSNPMIMPELFDWHHIALLGDIHKRQNIQEERLEEHKPCIHYCGSLFQQNHGESLNGHGYTLWNLIDYSYKYCDIQNECGYFTVDLHGAKILTDLSELPRKTYLRVRCLDCIPSEIKAAEAKIATLTEIVETSRIRVESEFDKKSKETLICQHVNLLDIAQIDYQNKLISEFLETKLNIRDKNVIDKIFEINKICNSELKKEDFSRNLKWIPIRFEWDNMFSYGEGNVIDFTKMNGVYGIFGPNTCGKSSIFSAMCFCLFDKWERGFKAVVARNVSKTNFKCKFEFEISGIRYFIEKIGETTRTGNVKVDVNFWRVVDGKNEDLTDQMRRKTNDVIRDYIGTFEDFILTTLSIQTTTKNNINFIDMGNTERKDLLVQFMGLNIFDQLYDIASNKNKELATLLKPHKDKNYIQELEASEFNLSTLEANILECKQKIEEITLDVQFNTDSIVTETLNIIQLDSNVPSDISPITQQRDKLSKLLLTKSSEHGGYTVNLANLKKALDDINDQLTAIDVQTLTESHTEYDKIKTKLLELHRTTELKKIQLVHQQEKLDKLKEHKYDPNCKFCVENIFVKDAQKTEGEIEQVRCSLNSCLKEIEVMQSKFQNVIWVETAYKTYIELLKTQSDAKEKYTSMTTQVLLLEKEIDQLKQTFQNLQTKIAAYNANSIAVNTNNQIQSRINLHKSELVKLNSKLKERQSQLLKMSGEQEVLKNKIKSMYSIIAEMIDIEEKRQLYEYYCQSVGRNGIPYQVICSIIPEIVREVNSILIQTTGFTIEIETDEKNIIPYVNYETKGRWPIEMTSGFERFVASVAIRVALNNITNLPRSSMLLIDEGWGSFDKENITSIPTLLSTLKHYYDTIIIVSHLDELRDFVEKQLEISKIGIFSKVVFS